MKFTLKWLKDHLDTKKSEQQIIDTLNRSSSFKNEKIINIVIPKIIKAKCFIKK